MTIQEFRNSELFLRNEFEKDGQLGFPIIKCQTINLDNLELIACSDISNHDEYNLHKGIHHFVDDYRFERWYGMGGRGTFASGNTVAYTYVTIEKIEGIKVLKGLNGKHGLPEETHSSTFGEIHM